jgi:hypothetical protein
MQKSESIKELLSALAKAQGQMGGAKKGSDNPFFKSRYADLSEVWEACRVPLSENGLAIIQLTDSGEPLTIETILGHQSGEWISSKLTIAPVKQDPQGIGSAITYARRYALAAIVGIAPEDDDAEAAMGRQEGSENTPSLKPLPGTATDRPKQQQQDAKDHWCSIHNCKYYKNEGKDGSVWYSHKVKETGKYCNEPKLKEEPKEDAMSADEFKTHLKTLGYPTQKAIIELLQAENWESVKAVYPTHEAILDAVSEASGIPWRVLEGAIE